MERFADKSQALVGCCAQGILGCEKTQEIQAPKDQAAAFRKAARDLDADAGDDQFKGVLRTLAKAKPSPEKRKNSRLKAT